MSRYQELVDRENENQKSIEPFSARAENLRKSLVEYLGCADTHVILDTLITDDVERVNAFYDIIIETSKTTKKISFNVFIDSNKYSCGGTEYTDKKINALFDKYFVYLW